MKRFFTFLLIVIACITASAERITEQQALQKALQFMQGKSFTMSQKARSLKAAPQKTDVFYVFNQRSEIRVTMFAT